MTDLKLHAMNATTMAITFADISDILKIILLVASIGFTLTKWYYIDRSTKDNKK